MSRAASAIENRNLGLNGTAALVLGAAVHW
jgi:hypothetical protein